MICKHCKKFVSRTYKTQMYCSSKCKDNHYRAAIKRNENNAIETSLYSDAIKKYFKQGGKIKRLPPEERPPKWDYLLTNLYGDQDDQNTPMY